MDIKLEITNLPRLQAALKAIPGGLRRTMQPVMRKAATIARAEQKNLLRAHLASNPNSESTGTLKEALRAVTVREGKSGKDKIEVLIGIVRKSGPVLAPNLSKKGAKPFYWIYFEKGYRHDGHFYHGKPFVGPSVKNKQSEILAVIENGVNRYFAAPGIAA